MDSVQRVAGVVLAAGAGRRMGQPKGLVRGGDGQTWAHRAANTLRAAGCAPVLVTIGAAAEQVVAGLGADVTAVTVPGWSEGLGASVRAAFEALDPAAVDAVLIIPVDVPSLSAADVQAVIAAAAGPLRRALVRAVHKGQPGHPVLIGIEHAVTVMAQASDDHGPRELLREAVTVELGPRPDLDTPADRVSEPEPPARS